KDPAHAAFQRSRRFFLVVPNASLANWIFFGYSVCSAAVLPTLLHCTGRPRRYFGFLGLFGAPRRRFPVFCVVVVTPCHISIVLEFFRFKARERSQSGCDRVAIRLSHNLNLARPRGWSRPIRSILSPSISTAAPRRCAIRAPGIPR